ncbi:hypothetical protein EK599_21595 [Vibrio sp. T187]|uniref:hypothetical protein n=1 Tax=Vibrio TaxID=662 RepID=UPI0010C96E51|nr:MULTISPECIES: hypothetical protein [Vibrio]MBW3698272.1 hypothetical protein [Vibrio sp. T187]
MFSQSLLAQLTRMIILLVLSLIIVHHSKPLLELIAQHAINSGCHQQSGHEHQHSSEHHH